MRRLLATFLPALLLVSGVVAGGSAVPAIAAEPAAQAVTSYGVAAWGDRTRAQTGVPDMNNVVAISADTWHGLALRADGTIMGWGSDNYGVISIPPGLNDVIAMDAGRYHSLAVRSDHTVVAWGLNNYGQTNVPSDLTDVVSVAGGVLQSLALRSDGTVVGWGGASWGATVPDELRTPSADNPVTAISAGSYFSLALRKDGTVVGWGSTSYGELDFPADFTDVVAISGGDIGSIALRSDGTVVAWGSMAQPPADLKDVTAIAAGSDHSLALRKDGSVVAWGGNDYFQSSVPAGVTGATGVAAGGYFSAAMGPVPVFTKDSPPTSATVGENYSYTFETSGPAASFPQYWDPTGTLPDGLYVSSNGVLSGTPTQAGEFTFTAAARNAYGVRQSASHTITVAEPGAPTITGTAPGGTVGEGYDYTYEIAGSPAPTVSLRSGTLPPGVTLSTSGRLTGTPTTAGTFTFAVQATNSTGYADVSDSITIAEAAVAPTISGDAPAGTTGTGYDYRYTIAGTPTAAVSLQSGSLPPGLTLSASGRLTGTPTTAGTYSYTMQAVSSAGTAQAPDSITITAAAAAPNITGVVAAGIVGSPYDSTYTVTGTPAPVVTVTSGTLPPGLTLDLAGRLTGTPTKAGTYLFTVQATNSAGTATAQSTLTVSPKTVATKADLRVDLSAPTTAVKGKTFTYTLITKNAGPATSTSVYSKVILPPDVQFVSATGKYSRIGNIVLFQRSSLTNGQTVTEKITVKATSTGKDTALAATFSAKTPDPSIRTNTDTAATTIR